VQAPDVTSHMGLADGGGVELEDTGGWVELENASVYNRRFGESAIGWLTMSTVAANRRCSATWLGDRVGFCARSSAAAPATWGHAMDVPLIVALAVSDEIPADVIVEPGAKMSRQDP